MKTFVDERTRCARMDEERKLIIYLWPLLSWLGLYDDSTM